MSLVVVDSSQVVGRFGSIADLVVHENIVEGDESGPAIPEHVLLMDADIRALTQPSPCPSSQIYLRRRC